MATEQVWAVTMVRDEADVILPLLDHLTGEGVDGVVVADNLSTDGTGGLLATTSAHVVRDPDPAYRQSEKMTALAAHARALAGTDDLWIVPLDADEIWYDGYGLPLAQRLRSLPLEDEAVWVPIWNHWCTPHDDPAEPDPFRRIRWREPHHQDPLGKVAYRWSPDLVIDQGNHAVLRAGVPVSAEFCGLALRHFPYRSPEHFVAKARNGAAAYKALEAEDGPLPDGMGGHWRGYGDLLSRWGEQAARDWFAEHFFYEDPGAAGLVEDPAPVRTADQLV